MKMKTLPAWLLLCLMASMGEAENPFDQYPENVERYLARLYQEDQRQFAFREDYPGGFTSWKKEARQELIQLIGLDKIRSDNRNHNVSVDVGKLEDLGKYTRQQGSILTEPDVRIPFWMLKPKAGGPHPLAILPHGHDERGWHSYAGVAQDEEHEKAIRTSDKDVAVQAVRRGFLAVAPATRGLGTDGVPDFQGRHGKRDCRSQLIHCLLAGRTAIGERVWDMQTILDWATQLSDVDAKKVLVMGNSGGGMVTLYTSACDDRITLAVPSCSFTSATSPTGYIFHCDCNLVPGLLGWGDLPEVAGLTAPRHFLAVNGHQDRLHSAESIERAASAAAAIFKAAGVPERFEHRWGESGHKFYPDLMWPFVSQVFGLEN
jgi:hypothetical protein